MSKFDRSWRDSPGCDESHSDIGNDTFSAADVGTLQRVKSFDSVAPYLGVGYDFAIFGKVGVNFDFGMVWQGKPMVTLEATGLAKAPPDVQASLTTELETERLQLKEGMSDFKAWPVVSLGFIYSFQAPAAASR